MDNFKTTEKKPTGKMGEKHEKEFSKATSGIQFESVDHLLNEKEQSFKKKIFDLAKMEALVHSDEKLNGVYNTMSENGEEKYGYHHNETIMNMMFNKYILGDRKYLARYKMAIPEEKKRRDKSGIRKMQKDLGTTPEPELNREGDVPIHNNSVEGVIEELNDETLNNEPLDNNLNTSGGGTLDDRNTIRIEKKYDTTPNTMKETDGESIRHANDRAMKDFEDNKDTPLNVNDLDKPEKSFDTANFIDNNAGQGVAADANQKGYKENPFEGEIKETTSAGGSAGAAGDPSRADGYQYSGPFGGDRNKGLDAPAWKGGEVIAESNYIVEPDGFKAMVLELNETALNSPSLNTPELQEAGTEDDSVVPMAEAGAPASAYNASQETATDEAGMKELYGKLINDVTVLIQAALKNGSDPSALVKHAQEYSKVSGIPFKMPNSGGFMGKVKNALFNKDQAPESYGNQQTKNKSAFEGVDADGNPLVEHHLEGRDEKINYILQNGNNKFGDADMLNHLDDDDVHRIYLEVEKMNGMIPNDDDDLMRQRAHREEEMGAEHANAFKSGEYDDFIDRADGVNEKAVSKNQQQFMGMVHATQKGDLENPSAEVAKVAGSIKPDDAEDFASTKHDGLPTKVKEAEYDAFGDAGVEKQDTGIEEPESKVRKVTRDELINLFDNIKMGGMDDENTVVGQFIESKGLRTGSFKEAVTKIMQSGQLGSEEDNLYREATYLTQIIDDIADSEGAGQGATHPDYYNVVGEAEEGGNAFEVIARKLSKTVPHLANDANALAQHTQRFLDLFFNGKSAEEVLTFIGENPDNFRQLGESMINPEGSSIIDTMKNIQGGGDMGGMSSVGGIGEGEEKIEEDGHCRKDEQPVSGVIAGQEGSCEKKDKYHVDPEDRAKNKHNVEARIKRRKEHDRDVQTKKSEHENDIDKHKKQMEKMKKVNEGDKRHTALVMLDRLQKDNASNFKSDMKDSNTEQSKDAEVKMQAIDQLEKVGDEPYANGEKIEKDVLKKTDGEALKNVGNSTNAKGDELPKRNYTDDEAKDVDLFRAGQEDWDYENDVDGKFEDRMKEHMGDDMHKKRVAKREDREGQLRYDKDRVPVSTNEDFTIKTSSDVVIGGDNIILKEGGKEFKSKDEDGKLVFEAEKAEQLVTGKYRGSNGLNKFVNFKLSEAVETEDVEGMSKLNLDGLGNAYSTVSNNSITENVDMRNLMDNAEFFFNGTEVVKKTVGKQNLSEAVVSEDDKPLLNEDVEKMNKLAGYDPSKFVNTTNNKKNGWNF